MIDWEAKRARIAEKLKRVGGAAVVEHRSKSATKSAAAQSTSITVFALSRKAETGGQGKVRFLVSAAARTLEGGVIVYRGRRYEVLTVEQKGFADNHLVSEVVANEL